MLYSWNVAIYVGDSTPTDHATIESCGMEFYPSPIDLLKTFFLGGGGQIESHNYLFISMENAL